MDTRKLVEPPSEGVKLRVEVPSASIDVRIVNAPNGLIRAGQEYLRRKRDEAARVHVVPTKS